MLTNLEWPGTPDPRNSSVDKFWAEESLGCLSAYLSSEIPRLRNLSTKEFLESGVMGHPRVVSIQGWFLAGPKVAQQRLNRVRKVAFELLLDNFFDALRSAARVTREHVLQIAISLVI